MVKHVLVAVAAATALLSGGSAHAAQQQCGVVCLGGAVANPCDDVIVIDCSICLLPESSPLVPCIFES